jgi:hypothetical protein
MRLSCARLGIEVDEPRELLLERFGMWRPGFAD